MPGPPVFPGEADPDPLTAPVPVPGTGEDGVKEPEGVADGGVVPVVGGTVGAVGPVGVAVVGGAGGVDGATDRVPAGASAAYARGAVPRANAQANVQVSAGPRARARVLRSAGVTG
ncbi:hypothetical protein GCM10017674_45010 [Streptomyces gardneri]|uniref:Uncharacterized protein n=1 Tax=Streptomyces gardneri TaxID=66892 RepID=A0A4Y3RQL6_9ACTN|nr:hypothetical protein SGA01_52090 [Streptomyces gardneri]GHH05538.1 hypothetical protein GCM10017674_45010 [Streptomyces gardneri]